MNNRSHKAGRPTFVEGKGGGGASTGNASQVSRRVFARLLREQDCYKIVCDRADALGTGERR